MTAKYAYSLNGENYIGSYDSRDAARDAALAKSSGMVDPPVSVFVGEILGGDPQVNGHGRGVIEEIRRRSRETETDEVDGYLAHVSLSQLSELDGAIAKALSTWLEKYRLSPKSFRTGAISEYTVPMPHRNFSNTVREVQGLGVSEYPADSSR